MRVIHQFIIVLLTFCMMSCVTTTSYFKTLPPEFVLPEGYESATVISAFDPTFLDFNQKKKAAVFSEGASKVVNSLAKNLNDEKQMETFISDSLLTGRADVYHDLDSLNREQRASICRQMNTSFLIVLESYSLDLYQDVDVVENDDGSKTRTAHYDLVAAATIRLYDKEGLVFDSWYGEQRVVDYDTRYVLSGLLAVGPLMAKAGKEVNELSEDIGKIWVDRLSPSEEVVIKTIYDHKSLGASTDALRRRDWSTAISILTPLTLSDDNKISGRAAHNLSVAYEALNDLESARSWSNLAEQKLGRNHL